MSSKMKSILKRMNSARDFTERTTETTPDDSFGPNGLQKSSSEKSFSNSSFFDPKSHPTISDQVNLCREIAKQLVCEQRNQSSKGRKMFEKRVEKSLKWETSDGSACTDQTQSVNDNEFHERTITEGPPNLRLVLDPRHVQDIKCLDSETVRQIVCNESKAKTYNKSIVKDLTSPKIEDLKENKGKELFRKLCEKSEEWIVANDSTDEQPLQVSSTTTIVETMNARAVIDDQEERARAQQLVSFESHERSSEGQESERVHSPFGECHVMSLARVVADNESEFLSRNRFLTDFQRPPIFYPKYRDFNSKAKPFLRMF